MTPVLCFIDRNWPLFGAPDAYAGVRLDGPESLRKAVIATAVLDSASIERLSRFLAAALVAN